jgi:hypothetical protein
VNQKSFVGRAFEIDCDGSFKGIGGVLVQDGHPIAFMSRQLTSPEEKYDTQEVEVLAIIVSLETFRPFLALSPHTIVVFTDHKNLSWLAARPMTHRLARWQLRLQEFKFEIRFRPGKQHSHVDALSRCPQPPQPIQAVISPEKDELSEYQKLLQLSAIGNDPSPVRIDDPDGEEQQQLRYDPSKKPYKQQAYLQTLNNFHRNLLNSLLLDPFFRQFYELVWNPDAPSPVQHPRARQSPRPVMSRTISPRAPSTQLG